MNDRRALLDLAREAEKRGDQSALVNVLGKLAAIDPGNTIVRARLGTILLERGDWEGAFRHLEAARARRGRDPAVLSLWSVAGRRVGRLAEVIEVLREATEEESSSPLLVLLADALFELGLDRESRQTLTRAVEIDPNNEEACYNLAVALRGEDPERALELLNRAIAIDPLYMEAHRERAYSVMVLGHWLEADSALQTALDLDPQDSWGLIYRAVLAMRRGQLDQAEIDLTAVAQKSKISMTHWLLGDLHMARGDISLAQAEYALAIEASPYDLRNLQRLRDADPATADTYWSELLRAMKADDDMLRDLIRDHSG